MISVVMPTFNSETYLKESVESIFKQTLLPNEIIFVDDASTDKTVDLLTQIKHDSAINCVLIKNSTNKGPSFSRNRGILQAQNIWISFIDSDDLWQADHLKSLYDQAIISSNPFVFSGLSVVNMETNDLLMSNSLFQKNLAVPYVFYRSSPIMPSQALVSKAALLACGGFDESLRQGEDSDLCINLYHHGAIFISTNLVTTIYRKRKHSASANLILASLSSAYRMQKYSRHFDFSSLQLRYWAFIDLIAAARLSRRDNIKHSFYYLGLALMAAILLDSFHLLDLKKILAKAPQFNST